MFFYGLIKRSILYFFYYVIFYFTLVDSLVVTLNFVEYYISYMSSLAKENRVGSAQATVYVIEAEGSKFCFDW